MLNKFGISALQKYHSRNIARHLTFIKILAFVAKISTVFNNGSLLIGYGMFWKLDIKMSKSHG